MTFLHSAKNKTAAFVLFVLLFFVAEGTCQTVPEKEIYSEGSQPVIVIYTDKPKYNVFLNDEFTGVTPLTITGLIPGQYTLRIESKSKSQSFIIEANKEMRYEYFFTLDDKTSEESLNSRENKYKPKFGPLAQQ